LYLEAFANYITNQQPMLKKLFYFLLYTSICVIGSAQEKPDSNFHLYLLAGQSNMAGRGIITEQFAQAGNPNILMLNKTNQWVPAKHPLHFDKPAVIGVGPGLGFAIEMLRPGIRIGLIPCAVGGSSINAWRPGAYDSSTKTHPYDDAISRLSVAMKDGVVKGVIWHQGESDSDPDSAKVYLPKLLALIQAWRDVTHQPELPFVAGELGRYREVYGNINRVIATLPRQVPFTAVVSSKGLKEKGDRTHFDAVSENEFGKRYARQMKRLQQQLRKSVK
jgi:hypothetical protein